MIWFALIIYDNIGKHVFAWLFFADPFLKVPKSQKSQGQELAKYLLSIVHSYRPRTYLSKVILGDNLNYIIVGAHGTELTKYIVNFTMYVSH